MMKHARLLLPLAFVSATTISAQMHKVATPDTVTRAVGVYGSVEVDTNMAGSSTGDAIDLGDRHLSGRRLGHASGQLVGLVDHNSVVRRDHRHAFDRVDREQ